MIPRHYQSPVAIIKTNNTTHKRVIYNNNLVVKNEQIQLRIQGHMFNNLTPSSNKKLIQNKSPRQNMKDKLIKVNPFTPNKMKQNLRQIQQEQAELKSSQAKQSDVLKNGINAISTTLSQLQNDIQDVLALQSKKLKFHERKLLKKVDLYNWKREQNHREQEVIKRYHIQNRDDYDKYNRVCGQITSLISKIKALPSQDPYRIKMIEQMLEKLYNMGIISSKDNILACEKLPVSAFCRRRLPILLCKLKLAQTPKEACTYIEQGHIRIGPKIITDSALLVTRSMEDHITWADQSKIKQKVTEYNNERDDYIG